MSSQQDHTEKTPLSPNILPDGLAWDRGLLVYTGSIFIDDPDKMEREQRMNELVRQALER